MTDHGLKISEGVNAESVRNALSRCSNFEDVRALGVLFHGTTSEIKGSLQGGAYDDVFWAADKPTVAQAYIPKSGVTTFYHKSYEDERDEHLTPCLHDSPSMNWALARVGLQREDMDITWNGLRPACWVIPEGWPTCGEWDDYLEAKGYEADDRGVYDVSVSYETGVEEIMPAKWMKPGQLIIIVPDDGFSVADPDWSEDALEYNPHNRIVDFAQFSKAGIQAIRMEDELQSDHFGNVGHEAIGILREGLKKLSWIAIPCVRNDGPDFSAFTSHETPEFLAFMKEINPSYISEFDVKNLPEAPVEERKYAVMTDSHRPHDHKILARMAPDRTKVSGFWTEDNPDDVWAMDREDADDIVRSLKFNNPRVVRIKKALGIIEAQRDEKKLMSQVVLEDPFCQDPTSVKDLTPTPEL